jgi:hypothetical protein
MTDEKNDNLLDVSMDAKAAGMVVALMRLGMAVLDSNGTPAADRTVDINMPSEMIVAATGMLLGGRRMSVTMNRIQSDPEGVSETVLAALQAGHDLLEVLADFIDEQSDEPVCDCQHCKARRAAQGPSPMGPDISMDN